MLLTSGCPLFRRKSPHQPVLKFACANLLPAWRLMLAVGLPMLHGVIYES
jgi:hypothetical protein